MTTFSDLNLSKDVLQAVQNQGYEKPTPIQESVIPLLLSGKDVIGQAQTGTGKTAAFALPMIQAIKPGKGVVQGLVLCPTRELAMQVAEAMTGYSETKGTKVLVVYGGQSYDRQTKPLTKGKVDIVVGTPGRMIDLINQGFLDLGTVRQLVLDEADEMLSLGFVEDIETILAETDPTKRQTALFSATLPHQIRRLADSYLHEPETVQIEAETLTVERIDQRFYLVNPNERTAVLTRLFEMEDMDRVLIFARTRLDTGRLASELAIRGFPAEALSGDLTQVAREHVMKRFKEGRLKVLVATDVAARGIDVDNLTHVINYEPPQFEEVYVHRIGRTGRAGAQGTAISLITQKELFRLRKIERYINAQIKEAQIPTPEQITARRNANLEEQMRVWINRDRCAKEKETVRALIDEGHDPILVAAVALKLAQSEDKKRPIAPVSPLRADDRNKRNRNSRDRRGGDNRGRGGRNGNGRGGGYGNRDNRGGNRGGNDRRGGVGFGRKRNDRSSKKGGGRK
ncbi:MAG: DEAD/DEAH box helicase [Chloroflexota bacterium]